MKEIIIALLTMLLLCASQAEADDVREIENAFRQYVEAAVHSDGKAAAEMFSDSAADYWDSILKDAHTLSRNELEKRPAYQLSNIILIRKRIEDDPAIAAMDGRMFLQHSYSKGWNSKNGLHAYIEYRDSIRLVPEINGLSAELKIKFDGEMLANGFPFVKENGQWKIDGKRQFDQLEKNTEAKIKDSGMSKAAFIDSMYNLLFGHPVPDRLWQPKEK
jgi:hypothetical protein